jgi:hypothetical protein
MEKIDINGFIKYLEKFYESIPKSSPNLTLGIEELTQLSFKYGKTNKELIQIFQFIMRREFEMGNLYGRIRFRDIKRYVDEEIFKYIYLKEV